MTRTHDSRSPFAADGFTLIELLIVVALIGVLASITAPFLISAKAAANEASAIGTTRTINSAQSTFSSTCGAGFFSATTTQLVNGDFASTDVMLPLKSGFSFTLGMGDTGAVAPSSTAMAIRCSPSTATRPRRSRRTPDAAALPPTKPARSG